MRKVLAAAGVDDPGAALKEAGGVEAKDALLLSPEFDPCSLHARPTDLMRRRQHMKAALAAGVVSAAAAVRVRTMRACQSHLSMRWRCGSSGGALARRSMALFGAVLELLLERGELGEGRIGIRLLVRRDPRAGLGVIELALGAIDRRAARPRRPALALRSLPRSLRSVALLLPFLPLLPLVAVLAVGALFAGLHARTRVRQRVLGCSVGRPGACGRFRRRGGACGRPCGAAARLVLHGHGLRRGAALVVMRAAVGAAGRTPNLDDLRLRRRVRAAGHFAAAVCSG